ncbi:MAG: selenoneine biosynthesis selenosugar synthase SenB [Hylemonella sp.]
MLWQTLLLRKGAIIVAARWQPCPPILHALCSDMLVPSKTPAQLPILIVSPALAGDNNGNWQTAWRWARLLAGHHPTRILRHWQTQDGPALAMLALHARRSSDSIAAWASAHPQRGLAVVLTGTDLYRDLAENPQAQNSLALAQQLVVLQELGLQALPSEHRPKARVIYQSTTMRQPVPKTKRHLRVVMVGHLREEKMPQTLWAAARLLAPEEGIRIDHIGAALDPQLGEQAKATMAACSHYRWLGGLTHEATRQRIQRAHLLVHCSRMEGGAHVLMEAVCSGTPVLASRIDGNVGMLGADYAGYFPLGDAHALVALLRQCRQQGQTSGGMLARLQAQCGLRQALFAPAAEQAALLRLIQDLTAP